MRNLTTTWLAVRTQQGDTRAAALRWLNSKAGTGYTSSRLNEWLRGDREPNRTVRTIMMRDCLPVVLSLPHSDIPKDYDAMSKKLT